MYKTAIKIIVPLLLLGGCAKTTGLTSFNGVITEVNIDKNDEITSVVVLKENGEKQKINIEGERWEEGQEVTVTQTGKNVTIEQLVDNETIETNKSERPLSEMMFSINSIEALNAPDIVRFNADELIESYFLDESKVTNAIGYMSNGNDATTVIIIETNDADYTAELQNVFDEIIEANNATFSENEAMLSLIENAYTYIDDHTAVLAIADGELIESISNIFEVAE